jgi:transposase
MTREFDPSRLQKLPTEQLISLIVQQQQIIEQLQQEVERLKASLKLDSQTSSKPPSTDLLKKPEKPKAASDPTKAPKQKPGGQPGHPGKTRQDLRRYAICSGIGSDTPNRKNKLLEPERVSLNSSRD